MLASAIRPKCQQVPTHNLSHLQCPHHQSRLCRLATKTSRRRLCSHLLQERLADWRDLSASHHPYSACASSQLSNRTPAQEGARLSHPQYLLSRCLLMAPGVVPVKQVRVQTTAERAGSLAKALLAFVSGPSSGPEPLLRCWSEQDAAPLAQRPCD